MSHHKNSSIVLRIIIKNNDTIQFLLQFQIKFQIVRNETKCEAYIIPLLFMESSYNIIPLQFQIKFQIVRNRQNVKHIIPLIVYVNHSKYISIQFLFDTNINNRHFYLNVGQFDPLHLLKTSHHLCSNHMRYIGILNLDNYFHKGLTLAVTPSGQHP